MLPGGEVRDVTTPPARTVPINSGTWFVGGITEKGRVNEPVKVKNLSQYIAEFGEFVTYGALYNALDVFFRERGGEAWVARIVGPDAESAAIDIPEDGEGEGVFLTATATSPGAWANGIKLVVSEEGESFKIVVQNSAGKQLEESGPVDKTGAIAWSKFSDYILLEDGGEGEAPKAGTYVLTAGKDDRENIATGNLTEALERFTDDLGPGQVSLPGYTSTAAHEVLIAHGFAKDRVPLLDLPDTHDQATLEAAVASLRDLDGAGKAAAYAPWGIVPGLTSNTFRTVPWSAIQAGIFARNDAAGFSINTAGAAQMGESLYAVDLSQVPWGDVEREELNEASVNVVKKVVGNIQAYGNRTLVDPEEHPQEALVSNARAHMVITAKAKGITDKYVFANIDGKGKTFSRLNGELRGMLGPYHSNDVLYGDSPEEAFYVDTTSVNTSETIQNKEINAAIEVRYSPAGERVRIDISRRLVTEAV